VTPPLTLTTARQMLLLAARYLEKKIRWFRVESAIFLFTRRVLAFFSGKPGYKFWSTRSFLYWAHVLINHRVNLGWTRGNRKGGGRKKIKNLASSFFWRYLAANDVAFGGDERQAQQATVPPDPRSIAQTPRVNPGELQRRTVHRCPRVKGSTYRVTPPLILTTEMQMLPILAATNVKHSGPQCLLTSPLQDIVSLQSFIAEVDHPCIALPPTCNAYPIAILSHAHCAIYGHPPSLPFYAIYHTILVTAISCKG